jgi:hypothetical protein
MVRTTNEVTDEKFDKYLIENPEVLPRVESQILEVWS